MKLRLRLFLFVFLELLHGSICLLVVHVLVRSLIIVTFGLRFFVSVLVVLRTLEGDLILICLLIQLSLFLSLALSELCDPLELLLHRCFGVDRLLVLHQRVRHLLNEV